MVENATCVVLVLPLILLMMGNTLSLRAVETSDSIIARCTECDYLVPIKNLAKCSYSTSASFIFRRM